MLTIFADAMMTATRTSSLDAWSDNGTKTKTTTSRVFRSGPGPNPRSAWKQIIGIW